MGRIKLKISCFLTLSAGLRRHITERERKRAAPLVTFIPSTWFHVSTPNNPPDILATGAFMPFFTLTHTPLSWGERLKESSREMR